MDAGEHWQAWLERWGDAYTTDEERRAAYRDHQEAGAQMAAVFGQFGGGHDEVATTTTPVDRELHAVLMGRGWVRIAVDAPADAYEWRASRPPADPRADQDYVGTTYMLVREPCCGEWATCCKVGPITVYFAAAFNAEVAATHYDTAAALIAALDGIEAYRAGDAPPAGGE